jgi:hypothetical protein
MQYLIRAPMATFTGSVNRVRFYAGVGQADLDEASAAWFTKRRYGLEEVAPGLDEKSYPELQAEAKALGLPASGKRAELVEAIAAEQARLAAEDATTAPEQGQAAGGEAV